MVVGNPLLAASDPSWGQLLSFCVRHGAYRGPPLPAGLLQRRGLLGAPGMEHEGGVEGVEAGLEEDELVDEMERLGLTGGAFGEDEGDEDSDADGYVQVSRRHQQEDPAWPEER